MPDRILEPCLARDITRCNALFPYDTLGEHRQAIRKVLTDAKIDDKDIEDIQSMLRPPQVLRKMDVTVYRLDNDLIDRTKMTNQCCSAILCPSKIPAPFPQWKPGA
jgi:hypothetical protein